MYLFEPVHCENHSNEVMCWGNMCHLISNLVCQIGLGYALLKLDIFNHLILCFYILYFIGTLNLSKSGLNLITIVGLKPETTYEVKISAINGKGEGESSALEIFKTQPVRKCLCLYVFLSLSLSLS